MFNSFFMLNRNSGLTSILPLKPQITNEGFVEVMLYPGAKFYMQRPRWVKSCGLGHTRDSIYRFKELYEQGGDLALQEIARRKPVLKKQVEEQIEKAVVALIDTYTKVAFVKTTTLRTPW
jgi:hypothetical protein